MQGRESYDRSPVGAPLARRIRRGRRRKVVTNTMNQALRKLSLTTHIIVSVGWLGAVAAYLALAIAGLTTQEQELARAAYISMAVIGKYVIIPLGLLTLVAGIVHALGTSWGLFRYWWILVKFALTTGAMSANAVFASCGDP